MRSDRKEKIAGTHPVAQNSLRSAGYISVDDKKITIIQENAHVGNSLLLLILRLGRHKFDRIRIGGYPLEIVEVAHSHWIQSKSQTLSRYPRKVL